MDASSVVMSWIRIVVIRIQCLRLPLSCCSAISPSHSAFEQPLIILVVTSSLLHKQTSNDNWKPHDHRSSESSWACIVLFWRVNWHSYSERWCTRCYFSVSKTRKKHELVRFPAYFVVFEQWFVSFVVDSPNRHLTWPKVLLPAKTQWKTCGSGDTYYLLLMVLSGFSEDALVLAEILVIAV